MGSSDTSDTAAMVALVRERDRPRYFATLFAPADLRRDLFALYGFAAEIERVPQLVSEPGLGEIRLRWWLEALEGLRQGGRPAHPALRELQSAVQRRALPLEPLVSLVEARRADLYADPPETLADLEGYLGETQSALFQLACLVAGARGVETADAAGHAGVAYGLTRTLANFAGGRGRSAIVPLDFLQEEGLTAFDTLAGVSPQPLARMRAKMIEVAKGHLHVAGKRIADLPAGLRPVFLPLATTRALIGRVARSAGANPLGLVELSDLESLIRLGLARLRGNSL